MWENASFVLAAFDQPATEQKKRGVQVMDGHEGDGAHYDISYAGTTSDPALGHAHAEIARLKALVAKLDGQLSKRPCQLDRCSKYAEAQRDAKRYRWLKDRIKKQYGIWYIDSMGHEGPTEIDAAIDYAIKNEQ